MVQGRAGHGARRGRGAGFRRRDALFVHSLHFGPNMTPMVDVVMVILVFFMAATAFVGREWSLRSRVELEGGRAAMAGGEGGERPSLVPTVPDVRLEIVLGVDEGGGAGRTVASGVGVSRAPLEEVLGALRGFAVGTAKEKIVVVVRADPRVAYEDVVRVHEACEEVGIERVGVGGVE